MNSIDRISLGKEFFGLSNDKSEKKEPGHELEEIKQKPIINRALALGLNWPETFVSRIFSEYIPPFELLRSQMYVSKAWHVYINQDILKVAVKALGFTLTPQITPGKFLCKHYMALRWMKNPSQIKLSKDFILTDGLIELARTYPEGFKEKHVEMITSTLKRARIRMNTPKCLTTLEVMIIALLLLPHNHNIPLFNTCMNRISKFPTLFMIFPRDFGDPSNRIVSIYEILRLVPNLFEMIHTAFNGQHKHYDALWTLIRNNRTLAFANPNVPFRYRQSEQFWSGRKAVDYHNQKWQATLNIIIQNPRERQYAADFQLIPPLLNA